MDSNKQITPLTKTPSATKPSTQDQPRPLAKCLLMKHIHQYLYICPYICPGDTPDATQHKSERIFIPEELHKIFGYQGLRNYFDVITAAKNDKLNIGGTLPPTLGEFPVIPKKIKVKKISSPKRFLQRIIMNIGNGD